jgi:imidazolonepropionase
MLIRNLAGLFTCRGFEENGGRHPDISQADFTSGPMDIYINDGLIRGVGRNLAVPSDCEITDGSGQIAIPALVDSHTHAVFAGDRSGEFFKRWAGRSYLDIAQSGGGISATQRWTAEASDDELFCTLVDRLSAIQASGVAAVEVKSGYGRNAAEELRLLRIIKAAGARLPSLKILPTFLGLHALPAGREETEFVNEMIGCLTEVAADGLAVFVDSFPELGFFSLEESLRFSQAARQMGFKLKVHADELSNLGTSGAFVSLGATSIDHLQQIDAATTHGLRSLPTVATLLPATSFYLGLPYANARTLLNAGAKVALATDYNPGTAPNCDLRFTAALAASQLKMTPAEILCGITYNAAQALDLGQSHGVIAPERCGQVVTFEVGNLRVAKPEELLARWILR